MSHLAFLRSMALSMVGEACRADDLVHATLEKALNNLAQFTPGSNMRAWLFTILRNTYCSDRRVLGREVSDIEGRATAMLAVQPAHDGRLVMADFMQAFATLPLIQREALSLVGALGYTYEEAAALCGVATGTMKSRTNRARARLAEILDLRADCGVLETDKTVAAVLSSQRSLW